MKVLFTTPMGAAKARGSVMEMVRAKRLKQQQQKEKRMQQNATVLVVAPASIVDNGAELAAAQTTLPCESDALLVL